MFGDYWFADISNRKFTVKNGFLEMTGGLVVGYNGELVVENVDAVSREAIMEDTNLKDASGNSVTGYGVKSIYVRPLIKLAPLVKGTGGTLKAIIKDSTLTQIGWDQAIVLFASNAARTGGAYECDIQNSTLINESAINTAPHNNALVGIYDYSGDTNTVRVDGTSRLINRQSAYTEGRIASCIYTYAKAATNVYLAEGASLEIWLKEKFGKSLIDVIMVISMILGVALGVGLFFFLPLWLSSFVSKGTGGESKWYATLIEGGIKIGIFILYIWLVSFMKDIKRVFEYHGAEHKTIFCYEAGEELTPENVKKFKRFHPRCGTSFIFVILLLSILVSSVVYSLPFIKSSIYLKFASKLLTLPLTVGIGYEFIRFAGKHDNVITRLLSAPGLWMQKLTTKEPDETQIEVAIASLKCALPEEFPEAREIYNPEEYKKAEVTKE